MHFIKGPDFKFYRLVVNFIAVLSNVSLCLVCDFCIVATCPSIQLPTLLFVCVLLVLFLLFVVVFDEPKQKQGRGSLDHKLVQTPQYFLLLAVPRRLFCFGSLVILDVARCYLWLFTLYINIKIGKNSC